MKLRNPNSNYTPMQELDRNRAIEQADRENHKRGRDVEIGAARLILTSPNGSRWSLSVDDLGAVSATAL